jgi:hypothetical protein
MMGLHNFFFFGRDRLVVFTICTNRLLLHQKAVQVYQKSRLKGSPRTTVRSKTLHPRKRFFLEVSSVVGGTSKYVTD